VGHTWPWYALALVSAYWLTSPGFDAAMRRVARIASQANAEHSSAARISAAPVTDSSQFLTTLRCPFRPAPARTGAPLPRAWSSPPGDEEAW
jgi:hypothetical protein